MGELKGGPYYENSLRRQWKGEEKFQEKRGRLDDSATNGAREGVFRTWAGKESQSDGSTVREENRRRRNTTDTEASGKLA